MERPFESLTSELPDSLDSASPLNVSNIDVIPVAAWRSSPANETAEEHMDRDRSIIAQNAGTTAAAIYNAVYGAGPWDPETYDAIRLHVFNGTLELAGAGVIVEQFTEAVPTTSAPAPRPQTGSSSTDNGAGIELNFGKYKGQTIRQVADSGEQGVSWLNWVADESNNNFIKGKADEFLRANSLRAA